MPVYTYRCADCGHEFEQYQKFSDPALTRCPQCNKKSLHKVYSAVGIVFKGSGFYSTDHRSPSGAPRTASKGGEGEKSGPNGAGGKSESASTSSSSTAGSSGGSSTSE